MQTRKIVKSGAASYTISLPKDWIVRNKLDKGDMVYINEESGDLSVSVGEKQFKKVDKEISISVDNKELPIIAREITSAYINNYNTINIIGKDLVSNVKEVRKILHDFVALEIAEQTQTKIVAKDLLNLNEISIDSTLRRMDMIVRSMIQDINAGGENIYESIYFRDFDINRLYFLVFRLLKSALGNVDVAKSLGVGNQEILKKWYLAVNLENIADNLKNIAKNESSSEEINRVLKLLEQEFLNSMKAYHKDNVSVAMDITKNRNNLIGEFDNLLEKDKDLKTIKILHEFRDLENSICNVARLVLDS